MRYRLHVKNKKEIKRQSFRTVIFKCSVGLLQKHGTRSVNNIELSAYRFTAG